MKRAGYLVLGVGMVLVGVGVVVTLGWLAVSWFLSLPVETQTPVAALTGVVLLPFITYLTTRALERRRSLEASLREKKTALYDEMIRGLMGIMNLSRAKKMGDADMLKFFSGITPRMITYGSRDVIKAWNNFRKISRTVGGANPILTMASFENLLKAMRKDLGHGVRLQPQGELLGIFINDIETIDFKSMKVAASDPPPPSA